MIIDGSVDETKENTPLNKQRNLKIATLLFA